MGVPEAPDEVWSEGDCSEIIGVVGENELFGDSFCMGVVAEVFFIGEGGDRFVAIFKVGGVRDNAWGACVDEVFYAMGLAGV